MIKVIPSKKILKFGGFALNIECFAVSLRGEQTQFKCSHESNFKKIYFDYSRWQYINQKATWENVQRPAYWLYNESSRKRNALSNKYKENNTKLHNKDILRKENNLPWKRVRVAENTSLHFSNDHYKHAQKIIENKRQNNWNPSEHHEWPHLELHIPLMISKINLND